MKTWIAVVVLAAATTAFAGNAGESECSTFLTAFKKAGKAVGKSIDDESAAFWKKQCLKTDAAEVKKSTSCFDAVKTEADLGKCMR